MGAAQEENAQRLFLPAQGRRPANLMIQLIDIVDDQRMAGLGENGLILLHHRGEQLVAAALDHDQDAVALGLLQVFGIGIQFEALGFHDGHNSFPGLLTDIGMSVQDPGHGTQGVPGFPGQVLNGHNIIPSRRRQQHP